ncbi:MAG: hypothetical protein JXR84_22535 [Anaerolineae bacterium]|nr:hypothetical protein [Anaerolineae bacterium]
MIELAKSKLFTPWTDPDSGVTSYILTQKVAPVQEAFYFVNNSITADGRYWWFYCAFPPSGTAGQGRTLGVLDFATQEVRHFPDTQFNHASPFVADETGDVYWGMGDAVWRRGPQPHDDATLVNRLPEELTLMRPIERVATHLTKSADGRAFFIDASVGLQFLFGALPVDGSDFELWHTFQRNHNHAQFSPTDPNCVLFAEENHPDPITGLRFRIIDRLWLIRRGEKPHPIMPTPTRLTHEWWDPDGQHVYCIKSDVGVWRVDIATGAVEEIPFPGGRWHSHSSVTGQYLIGDANPRFYRGCPSTVNFLNRETGKSVRLVDNPEMPNYTGAKYHIDPHPRFCFGDQVVVFTTTVRGVVDVAMAYTADLITRTS